MVTYFTFIGATVAGQWTNAKVYPCLGFIALSNSANAVLLNDSNVIDVANVQFSVDWQVDHVDTVGLVQIYP